MDASRFQVTQAPLKALYRKDTKAALLTLRARGAVGHSTVTCKVETGRGIAEAGIHPKCGGSGLELCSGDILLEALVACAGITLKAASTVLDIPIGSASVSAEGDVDLRGTLGVEPDVPVGFNEIRLRFDIGTEVSRDKLARLLAMTEQYCVVFQTLQKSPRTSVHIETARAHAGETSMSKQADAGAV